MSQENLNNIHVNKVDVESGEVTARRKNDCVFTALCKVLPNEVAFLRKVSDAYLASGSGVPLGVIGYELQLAGKAVIESTPIKVDTTVDSQAEGERIKRLIRGRKRNGPVVIRVNRLYPDDKQGHVEAFVKGDLLTKLGKYKLSHIVQMVVTFGGEWVEVRKFREEDRIQGI